MSPTSYVYIYLNYYIIYILSRAFEYIIDSEQLLLPPSRLHMVRSTIIVRASDALPLAASVDDEQVLL